MAAPQQTGPLLRTAWAWRRTGFVLLVLSLLGTKLTDVTGSWPAVILAVGGICISAVVIGIAESGIRSLVADTPRPVFPLLFGTAAVGFAFCLVGVVLVLTP